MYPIRLTIGIRIIFLCLSVQFVISKDCHIKEGLPLKNDIDEYIASPNLRFPSANLKRVSRHIEMEQGDVLSHILNKKQQHISKDNKSQFMERALKILEIKIRRLMKMKRKSRNKTAKNKMKISNSTY